jgi:putative transposase
MARPGRPERNRAARSFRQLRRFHHVINSDKVFGTHTALDARKPQPGSLIHHSDRGVQYASIAYRQRLAEYDITISMSRPGNPFDNAKAESFMKTLKMEEINGRAFVDINDARRRINGFIAEVYNKDRLHSALGYQSPLKFETAFAQNKAR